jgi:hypothetical protein
MTEGVERDIADDSKGGFLGLFALDGGGRWSEKTQRAKHQTDFGKHSRTGTIGGEAAGPRLKSVGCGKVNGVRGLDVKGLGSLPIPEGLGLGSAIAGRRAAGLRGYMGRYTADHTVQGTWVEQAGKELGAPGGEIR